MSRTILIAVAYAINVRDILRSNVFRILRESGHRIVILSPAWNRSEFTAEFGGDNVVFEELHDHRPGKWESWFDSMRFALFADLSNTVSLRTQPRVRRSLKKKIAVRIALLTTRIFGRKTTERLLAWLNLTLFPDPYYRSIFERYRPDLAILCRIFNFSNDYQVLKRAIRERVPTMLLVSSWDNLTGKGVFPARVDNLVVWSDMQVEEAVELHGYRPEQVFVGGGPQFDVYADVEKLPDRAAFFARIGADPEKRLLTLTMGGLVRCPHEFEIVEMLHDAAVSGRFSMPCQILARLHPTQKGGIPDHLRSREGLLFDFPGKESAYVDRDTSIEDLRHLAATMRYSDVILNTASTTTIDASVFDTPVVCIGFDGLKEEPYLDSVRRFYSFTHYKKLLDTGAIPVASSLEELIGAVNRYLDDPSLDREARSRIVKRFFGDVDGHAGERIGRFILGTLGSEPSRLPSERWLAPAGPAGIDSGRGDPLPRERRMENS